MKSFNRKKGFSLVELVLTMAILLIVLQVVYSVFFVGHKSYVVSTNTGFAQQGVRIGNLFVSDELEYATGLNIDDTTDFMTNYYTISYDSVDGELIWREFETAANPLDPDVKIDEKITKGKWQEILISNTETGKLDIVMTQIEASGGDESEFTLNFDVELLNAPNLSTNKQWDLVAGKVLYYTKNESRSFGSVNVEWQNESTQGDNSTSLQWGEATGDVVVETKKKNDISYTIAPYDSDKKGYIIGNNATVRFKLSYFNYDNEEVTITANSQDITSKEIIGEPDKFEIIGEHTPSNSIEYIVVTIEGQDSLGNTTGTIYKSIKLVK